MNRSITLQTFNLTKSKKEKLKSFSQKAKDLSNELLKKRKTKNYIDLHKATYLSSKKKTKFNSQVICEITRTIAKNKGDSVKGITVYFNVPRNCKTFETKSNYFVDLGMYPKNRVAVPIEQNKNYQRYLSLLENGWKCKNFGLTPKLEIVACLFKEETQIPKRKNMLGIDINSKCFAVSILSPEGKILNQNYFGKDIWVKRKKIFKIREKLQSLADKGSNRAKKSLIKIRRKETNFVKTRLGQITKEITELSLKFNADISIENLKRFPSKGKKFNKKVMRIPFYSFRKILEQRCFDKGITLNIVDAYHTSKWCSHCGAVAKNGHSSNYALFKCKECGQIVNSDRKASLAVAVKSLLERNIQAINHNLFFQISKKPIPVNGLLRRNDKILRNFLVKRKLNSLTESHSIN